MTVVNSVLTSLRYLFARTLVSEFYKKGCQEKSSTSTGKARRLWSRRPAHCSKCLPSELLGGACSSLVAISLEFMLDGDGANRVCKSWQASPWCDPCPPWFYRRLEAYRYFW